MSTLEPTHSHSWSHTWPINACRYSGCPAVVHCMKCPISFSPHPIMLHICFFTGKVFQENLACNCKMLSEILPMSTFIGLTSLHSKGSVMWHHCHNLNHQDSLVHWQQFKSPSPPWLLPTYVRTSFFFPTLWYKQQACKQETRHKVAITNTVNSCILIDFTLQLWTNSYPAHSTQQHSLESKV